MTYVYTNTYLTMRQSARSASRKVCDIPAKTVLTLNSNLNKEFAHVTYQTASGDLDGFVYTALLEDAPNGYGVPVVRVDIPQTTNPHDAAQYVIFRDNIQYNLCGEFCVAHLFGESIGQMLEHWNASPVSLINRVFYGGKARGTSPAELQNMVAAYSNGESLLLAKTLMEYHPQRKPALPPHTMAGWLNDGWKFIVGVSIEGQRGELRPSGILHWVVVESIEFTGGVLRDIVKIYNPFMNQMETYSWNEFATSMKVPYGILVKVNN